MPKIRSPDETRITKLENWLDSIGQDYLREGDDVRLPSPFKEREKARTEGPGYRDQNYRLWVTICTDFGKPQIVWQCWYSKRPNGKPFGGHDAYGLSVRTGVDATEICRILDVQFDEEVHRATNLQDKVQAILTMGDRTDANRARLEQEQAQEQLVYMEERESLIPLGRGLPMVGQFEQAIYDRGILPSTVQHYGLMADPGWDMVWAPWRDAQGVYAYHQWWNFDEGRYAFPKAKPGVITKSHLLYGLDVWNPSLPLVLCEGLFEVLTLGGVGIGGSILSNIQLDLLVALNPRLIILALDKDGAGIAGAQQIKTRIKGRMPNTEIVIVFPPTGDWNDLAKQHGQEVAIAEFVRRVQEARQPGNGLLAQVRQMMV